MKSNYLSIKPGGCRNEVGWQLPFVQLLCNGEAGKLKKVLSSHSAWLNISITISIHLTHALQSANSFSNIIFSGKLPHCVALLQGPKLLSWLHWKHEQNPMKYRRMILYSILERGGEKKKKELPACALVCLYVFTVPFIAKVDLLLYKAAS